MRWLLIGCVVLAGCSQKQEAGDTATRAGALAFQYSYTFRLPSARIAAARERHAQACEQLGAARCRITGMSYNVDSSGDVDASLALALAAPIARGFGREGVAAIEQAGGVLAEAAISGTDPAQVGSDDTATPADAGHGAAEVARIDRQLARADLSGAERAELTRQRAVAADRARASVTAATNARAAVRTTPVSFAYRAGRGVGAAAEFADAGQTAYSSLLTTLSIVLMALAVLGPPVLLLLALVLLWRRWRARFWAKLFPPRAPA